jgi:hypothetical protein
VLAKLRPKLTYANVVSTLCLFILLGGSSYAAVKLGRNAVKSKNIAADAVTSPKVKNGSLISEDFRPGQLPSGPGGPAGDPGAPGTNGVNGTSVTSANEPAGPNCANGGAKFTAASGDTYACNGAQGDPGPFPGTLPSGKTLRGVYYAENTAAAAADRTSDSVSFGFTLASQPAAHYIASGATPPAQCPGTVNSPEAAPGHLCVYEFSRFSVTSAGIVDPTEGVIGQSSKEGFGVGATASGAGNYFVGGAWAVTSP